ncbi:MAG: ATPase domain-containing protein [Gemmatimonadaceae bacterium]
MIIPALQELRAQIDAVAESHAASESLPTGIAELDAALVERGIPRGRLTEITGARGSGKTTLVRGMVARAAGRGEWVAYVDASRTLAPRDWAWMASVWMVRPRSPARAAWCADVLLRSGAFGLVIVDGAPPLTRAASARLTRVARDGGSALVVLADGDGAASASFPAVRLRMMRTPQVKRKRKFFGGVTLHQTPGTRHLIVVEKGGSRRTVEVEYGWNVARRLCAHPEVPDRRGVERASAKADERDRAEAGAARPPLAAPTPRVAPRSARCAEPAFGRREPRAAHVG